ncbi:hypothetical protein ACFLZV_03790, partial [Candidatus Margulisiibacteriota bacterium]
MFIKKAFLTFLLVFLGSALLFKDIHANPLLRGKPKPGKTIRLNIYQKGLSQLASVQRKLNKELSGLLTDLKKKNPLSVFTVLLIAFIYGALHSLGPGHGKMLIS